MAATTSLSGFRRRLKAGADFIRRIYHRLTGSGGEKGKSPCAKLWASVTDGQLNLLLECVFYVVSGAVPIAGAAAKALRATRRLARIAKAGLSGDKDELLRLLGGGREGKVSALSSCGRALWNLLGAFFRGSGNGRQDAGEGGSRPPPAVGGRGREGAGGLPGVPGPQAKGQGGR